MVHFSNLKSLAMRTSLQRQLYIGTAKSKYLRKQKPDTCAAVSFFLNFMTCRTFWQFIRYSRYNSLNFSFITLSIPSPSCIYESKSPYSSATLEYSPSRYSYLAPKRIFVVSFISGLVLPILSSIILDKDSTSFVRHSFV